MVHSKTGVFRDWIFYLSISRLNVNILFHLTGLFVFYQFILFVQETVLKRWVSMIYMKVGRAGRAVGLVKGRRAGIAPGWMEETSLETALGILYLRLEQFLVNIYWNCSPICIQLQCYNKKVFPFMPLSILSVKSFSNLHLLSHP